MVSLRIVGRRNDDLLDVGIEGCLALRRPTPDKLKLQFNLARNWVVLFPTACLGSRSFGDL